MPETLLSPIETEISKIEKEENKLLRAYINQNRFAEIKCKLEGKIPPKVLRGLQKAFFKTFSLIFEKGSPIIEKTYNRNNLEMEHKIRDYAVSTCGRRKDVGRLCGFASGGNAGTTVVTAIEGVGLGALGIGLPDIVLWVNILLRAIYKTALKYGFEYDSPREKLFILKAIEASLLSGEDFLKANKETDAIFTDDLTISVDDQTIKEQIEKTSDAFATEMLATKFIQGLPVVGMLGGAANPIYFHTIMHYVQLKYKKRYFLSKLPND